MSAIDNPTGIRHKAVMRKTLLSSVVAFVFANAAMASGESQFILVTVKTVWNDGMASQAGEIEKVVTQSADSYVVEAAGKLYEVPIANAAPVSPEQAATALLNQRTELYAEMHKAIGLIKQYRAQVVQTDAPRPLPRPTQYNGQPLPPNWIDPKQADLNFRLDEIERSIRSK
jgi:hypothetical protein